MSTRASSYLPAVLVVDPDSASANALASTLSARFAVGVAGSLAAAYQALAVMIPVLIVCELALPDGDGLALLQRLRSSPETRDVLLMVVSQRRSVSDKIAALRVGADDYLVKPVTPEVFANHAARLLRFRRTFH
ncbi:MAG TPA: response regulator [Ktedonobacterales bacterium]